MENSHWLPRDSQSSSSASDRLAQSEASAPLPTPTLCVQCKSKVCCSRQTVNPAGVRLGCELDPGHEGPHRALIGDVAEYQWKDRDQMGSPRPDAEPRTPVRPESQLVAGFILALDKTTHTLNLEAAYRAIEHYKGIVLRPALKHPTRTIIVTTRLSEQVLHTTYLNALDEDEPSVVTVVLSEPPHTPVAGGVPDVGQTTVTVNR